MSSTLYTCITNVIFYIASLLRAMSSILYITDVIFYIASLLGAMSSTLYITDVIFYIASLLGASRHSSLCWFVWREHFEAATYLIHSGWNLYPETWMYLPGKSQEQDLFHQWMRDICKDAPSLTQLCRGVIRHHFITCTAGREVSSSLSKLEIPRTLKDFLMLKA